MKPKPLDYATPERPLWPIMTIALVGGAVLVALVILVVFVICKIVVWKRP
jgi:hypothetical protein